MSEERLGPGRAERRLAAGCAAGMAIAAAGTWVRYALEGTLRIDTHTLPFVLASATSGVGLILAGACALRLAPRAGRLSWRALAGAAVAVQALALGALALTSSDLFGYLCYGGLARAGMSPYAAPPDALAPSPLLGPAQWTHDYPSPYGPLLHLVARGAAAAGERLGSPLWGAVFSFKAMMLAALLAALALAKRHLRARPDEEAKEIFAALALGPLLAWELPGQGHNDALLFLSVTTFLVAASRGRERLAAAALALGTAVKFSVAPLLGLYLVLAGRRSILRAAGLGLVVIAVLGAAYATDPQAAASLRGIFITVGGGVPRHAHSLVDLGCLVLDGLGHPEASRVWFRVLSLASAVGCLGLLARAAWRARDLDGLARGYLLFLFALFLTTPWFQPWYVSWALPLLLVERDPAWRRLLAAFAVVTVVQWAAPLDPVTTVLGDAWLAVKLAQLLRRGEPEGTALPQTA
ncbi:glycosyltransferase 87 family protein [Anaeromyxobacter paludicola]|uniref:DUF2029 domain-containing protein n=1 Tax=Anaeromyxobacter paludicola TaxID=2918171 RepID=A0ABN6NC63_9BACT|nr:glycosyltransferase 87 family protein [Anaeromyxobacter paludicola]BDG10853.1 hypothetical protein AMPC_39660 [Anaeromyxobacter paludicola]